jgi:hypothetical protein
MITSCPFSVPGSHSGYHITFSYLSLSHIHSPVLCYFMYILSISSLVNKYIHQENWKEVYYLLLHVYFF